MPRIYSPIGCPTLDALCGGGVPHESLIYIYGGAGLGKTTLALNMARAMGGSVWVDAGGNLCHKYALQEGSEDMVVINPQLLDAEADTVNVLLQQTLIPLIGTTPIIVVDDLTCLSGALARPLQSTMKKVVSMLSGSGTTLLITNQVRQTKHGSLLPPGGLSYVKYADLVLELGPASKRLGTTLNVDVSIVKSKVGPCQGIRTLPFCDGLDCTQDVLLMAVKKGVIEQKGSWYQYGDYNRQGLNSLRQVLTADTIYEIYGVLRGTIDRP
jgi:RecA/RadA recombinase